MAPTRIVLSIVLLALVSAGCGSEGNVFSLEVGDCFQSFEGGLVKDVEVVDCSVPHENEVYAVWNVAAADLPEGSVFELGCIDRFAEAVGIDYTESAFYSFPIHPSQESFDQGDREVICYGVELDDALEPVLVTGSLLGSGR